MSAIYQQRGLSTGSANHRRLGIVRQKAASLMQCCGHYSYSLYVEICLALVAHYLAVRRALSFCIRLCRCMRESVCSRHIQLYIRYAHKCTNSGSTYVCAKYLPRYMYALFCGREQDTKRMLTTHVSLRCYWFSMCVNVPVGCRVTTVCRVYGNAPGCDCVGNFVFDRRNF